MEHHNTTFPKAEHLTGTLAIETLFEQGNGFIAFPLRVVYQLVPKTDTPPIQVLVSVPKKRFKHAVDRNRFKRLIRESYRLNKHLLCNTVEQTNFTLRIAFCAVSNELPTFSVVEAKMQQALTKLQQRVSETITAEL